MTQSHNQPTMAICVSKKPDDIFVCRLNFTQEGVTAQPQIVGWDNLNQQRHKIKLSLSTPLDNRNPPTRPYEQVSYYYIHMS